MSTLLDLPRTAGCLACGRDNPKGLKIGLQVDPANGVVHVRFVPQPEHIGFEGIVHGGLIATVLDEAMVWASTWNLKRFCVCGELAVRFRSQVRVGATFLVEARVEYSRPKLIQAAATLRTPAGGIVAAAEAKYVPMLQHESDALMRTLVNEPQTQPATALLTRGVALDSMD